MESTEVMLYMTSNARHDRTLSAHNSWWALLVNTAVKGLTLRNRPPAWVTFNNATDYWANGLLTLTPNTNPLAQ